MIIQRRIEKMSEKQGKAKSSLYELINEMINIMYER